MGRSDDVRDILAQSGLPTRQQGADLVNGGEQLLCRARGVARRVGERVRALVAAHGLQGPHRADGGGAAEAPPAYRVWHRAEGRPDWMPVCGAGSREEAEAAARELSGGPVAWLLPAGEVAALPRGERPGESRSGGHAA